jgi:hypothetical protein
MTLSRQERWRNAATETWKRGLSDEDRAIAEHDEAMMGTEGAMDLALTHLFCVNKHRSQYCLLGSLINPAVIGAALDYDIKRLEVHLTIIQE